MTTERDITGRKVIDVMRDIEDETMKGVWLTRTDRGIFTPPVDTVEKMKMRMSDTITKGIDTAIRRMLDMGYKTDEIEIATTPSDNGFNIQIRSKLKHRKMTNFEMMIRRMFNEDTVKKIMKWLSHSDDIDVATLKRECDLHALDVSDLHSKMHSNKYMIVTQDLFHNCSPKPVATVEVQEAHPKPVIKHCPGCEKDIELGTAFWGGYHYRVEPYLSTLLKGEFERMNKLEDK